MKQLAPAEAQTVVEVSQPAIAAPAPPAAIEVPVSPPVVQAQLPTPEAPQTVAVEKPVVDAPLAAKPETAALPIPEPEKTLQPAPVTATAAAPPDAQVAGPPAAIVSVPDQPVTAEVTPALVALPQEATVPVQAVQQGNVIRDCADCPQLVAVTAGSVATTLVANAGAPAKTTTVDHDFAIGRYEITFDDWKKCVAEHGCLALPDDGGWGRDRRPLIFVSYDDISTQYLPWLSKLTGQTYRLPTKDEWQFAAAGGAGTELAAGQSGALSECFNGSGAASPNCVTAFNGTSPVGSFAPNALGVYDMKGNAWEWSADCWQPFSYAPKASGTACDMRLVLGGAWSTARNEISAQAVGWEKANKRTNSIGFRIVRSLP